MLKHKLRYNDSYSNIDLTFHVNIIWNSTLDLRLKFDIISTEIYLTNNNTKKITKKKHKKNCTKRFVKNINDYKYLQQHLFYLCAAKKKKKRNPPKKNISIWNSCVMLCLLDICRIVCILTLFFQEFCFISASIRTVRVCDKISTTLYEKQWQNSKLWVAI